MSTIETHGLPFFAAVCDEVFTGFMRQYHFQYHADSKFGSVYYTMDNISLYFSYIIMESSVPYELQVAIGYTNPTDNYRHAIGVWELIPEENPLRGYGSWYFMTREELSVVLLRLRNEVFEQFIAKYLVDRKMLVSTIKLIDVSNLKTANEHRQKHFLLQARNFFDIQNYKESLEFYKDVDVSCLSTADKKKISIARSKVHH